MVLENTILHTTFDFVFCDTDVALAWRRTVHISRMPHGAYRLCLLQPYKQPYALGVYPPPSVTCVLLNFLYYYIHISASNQTTG